MELLSYKSPSMADLLNAYGETRTLPGAGASLLEKSKEMFPNTQLFAFSKNGVFSKAGFAPIEGIVSSTGAQLYAFIPHS